MEEFGWGRPYVVGGGADCPVAELDNEGIPKLPRFAAACNMPPEVEFPGKAFCCDEDEREFE